jgi:threonine/homoserine/homoserine lactone efflux protein
MTLPHWLLFCGVSLLMCFTPGPAVLLAVSNSMDVGAKRTAFSSVGSSAGIYVVSGLAMLGMGAILSMSANAFLVMKVVGAMYLIWLGVKRWRSKEALISSDTGNDAPTDRRERKNWQLAAQGLGVSLTNPKSILFFSALFPQFIIPGEPLFGQYLLLTTTFAVCALVSHAFYVALISLVKRHVVAHARLFNRIVGGTFIALGLGLLNTRHKLG